MSQSPATQHDSIDVLKEAIKVINNRIEYLRELLVVGKLDELEKKKVFEELDLLKMQFNSNENQIQEIIHQKYGIQLSQQATVSGSGSFRKVGRSSSQNQLSDKPLYATISRVYKVKVIQFKGHQVRIVMQNENGPCSLLAIVNYLSLQNEINIPDQSTLSSQELIKLIGDHLLSRIHPLMFLSKEGLKEYETRILNDLIKYESGLNINANFSGVDKFVETYETNLFKLIGVRLLHGWISSDANIQQDLQNKSHDEITEEIATINSKQNATDEEKVKSQRLKSFLNETKSQLTDEGLNHLRLFDFDLAIMFRNNHFSVIHKHQNELYQFVTDLSYFESNAIWEKYEQINRIIFCNHLFQPLDESIHLRVEDSMIKPTVEDFEIVERQVEKNGKIYREPIELGKGSFGNVYLGIHKQTGEKVAIKYISTKKFRPGSKHLEFFDREIEINEKINDSRVVKLICWSKTSQQHTLVMELCDTDFESYLRKKGKLSEDLAKRFMKQFVSGIKLLYELNIVHRNLTPVNLLLKKIAGGNDDDFELKIGDFVLACELKIGDTETTVCGTPFYMAPEILQGLSYTSQVDLWSIGVIMYQMLSGKLPFRASNPQELRSTITSTTIKFEDLQVSAECVDLLNGLLQIDPQNRITFEQLFTHPWISLECHQ